MLKIFAVLLSLLFTNAYALTDDSEIYLDSNTAALIQLPLQITCNGSAAIRATPDPQGNYIFLLANLAKLSTTQPMNCQLLDGNNQNLGNFQLSQLNQNCQNQWCGIATAAALTPANKYYLFFSPVTTTCQGSQCRQWSLGLSLVQDGQLNIVGDYQGKPPATMLPFVMSCVNTDHIVNNIIFHGNPGTQGLAYNLQDISSELDNASSVRCIIATNHQDVMGIINLEQLGKNCQTPNAGKWCSPLAIAHQPLQGSLTIVPIGTPVVGQWCENTTEPCDQWNLIFHGIGNS